RGFNLQGERQEGRALEEEEGNGKGVATTTSAPSTPVAQVEREKGKGRTAVQSGRGQMMFAFIAVKRGIGRGKLTLAMICRYWKEAEV
ncbi:UNVERIFIED_CONTAM: hypothetical protein Sindi_0067600, partial [Sesamum indicum]